MFALAAWFWFHFFHSAFEQPTALVDLSQTTTIWAAESQYDKIFIGTGDGFVHDIDIFSGAIVWSLDTGGSMFNSTAASASPHAVSIDGYLYTDGETGLTRWPVPVRELSQVAPVTARARENIVSSKSITSLIIDEDGAPCDGAVVAEKPTATITRVNYVVNITTNREIIRWSELTVVTPPDSESYLHSVKVVSHFDGAVVVVVNDTYRTRTVLKSYPISVHGTNGIFGFMTNFRNGPMPSTSLALLETPSKAKLAITARSRSGDIMSVHHNNVHFPVLVANLQPKVATAYVDSQDFVRVAAEPPRAANLGFNVACLVVGVLFVAVLSPEIVGALRRIRIVRDGGRARDGLLRELLEAVGRGDAVFEVGGRIVVVQGWPFKGVGGLMRLGRLSVWSDDRRTRFADLVRRLAEGRGDNALGHPLFWSWRQEVDFLGRLERSLTGRDRRLSGQIEARRGFWGNWKAVYTETDDRYKEFMRIETEKRYIGHGSEALLDLVIYIRKKMRHVFETAAAAHIEIGEHTQIDAAVLDFLLTPFPDLILQTWDLVP
jgi:hypothetical protein